MHNMMKRRKFKFVFDIYGNLSLRQSKKNKKLKSVTIHQFNYKRERLDLTFTWKAYSSKEICPSIGFLLCESTEKGIIMTIMSTGIAHPAIKYSGVSKKFLLKKFKID